MESAHGRRGGFAAFIPGKSLLSILVLASLPVGSVAQDATKKPEAKTQLEEVEAAPVMWGEYQVHSSTDLGGVFTDFSGARSRSRRSSTSGMDSAFWDNHSICSRPSTMGCCSMNCI